MFEEYQFAGVYIAIQAVLTLYAQGMNLTTYSISLSMLYTPQYLALLPFKDPFIVFL